jgi:ABC-2 type transport system permease protein
MRTFWAVYKRELKSYLISPTFYIVAAVFIIVVGNTFKDTFIGFSNQTMSAMIRQANYGGSFPLMSVNTVSARLFTLINFNFLLIVPLLTMRIYAEERKNGTMELLMTSPVTTGQVLMGKFFSCLSVYTIIMLLTVVFNILIDIMSQGQLEWSSLMAGYLGSFLFGAAMISIGMFFSSVTENQIVAAALSLTFTLGLWMLIFSTSLIRFPLNVIVTYFSPSDHTDSFVNGIIGVKHIVYYLSMTTFWLVLTGISVESARWRQ